MKSRNTNDWSEVLASARLARYQAELAFYLGIADGDAGKISAAVNALKSGQPLKCESCRRDLRSGHSENCQVADNYEGFFGVRVSEPPPSLAVPRSKKASVVKRKKPGPKKGWTRKAPPGMPTPPALQK